MMMHAFMVVGLRHHGRQCLVLIYIVRPTEKDMIGKFILGCISNGDLLLLIKFDDYLWILCNADAKIVPLSVDMADYHYTRHVYKYTESLVSLAGFKQVNWNDGEDDN
ncbi:hypothetical protein POM88_005323 [Heracleum sosnowskyi]|uniref:Uncharacterized protein n=1 Tax=Heracleum sosnowskyi TaxID=360622 RepID=A0AAD8JLX8_9APIA|nr:hypothetical protein POM88_005323 [Heracleum sosnowskyi]